MATFRGFCPRQCPRLLVHPLHRRKDVCPATAMLDVHRRAKSHNMLAPQCGTSLAAKSRGVQHTMLAGIGATCQRAKTFISLWTFRRRTASTFRASSWTCTFAVAAFRGFCPQQCPRLLVHPPHQRKDVCAATHDAHVHRRAKGRSYNRLRAKRQRNARSISVPHGMAVR